MRHTPMVPAIDLHRAGCPNPPPSFDSHPAHNRATLRERTLSLELGGSNEQTNLWPEPYQGTDWNAHVKDQLENFLHAHVCSGDIALDQAQKEIAKDWIASYKKRLGNQ